MPADSIQPELGFLPENSIDPQAAQFFSEFTGRLDGQQKDPVVVEAELSEWDGVMERIAADLYRISSMLLGEGEDAVSLIERVVSSLDFSICSDAVEARHRSRLDLGAAAIAVLAQRDPAAFAAPEEESGPVSCIEEDDLSAAGLSDGDLEQIIAGPERQRLRDWLEGLPVSLRAIFVLRAVAGLSSPELAGLIAENGGPAAQDWNPEPVRIAFRQALCSLASQWLHTTAAR